jgi:MoaA/NifB/PqqE/SkfB family radical SAM enzyme
MFSNSDLDSDMKFIYITRKMDFTKNLGIKTYCDDPFRVVNVDKDGRVFICGCQAWLPISVGNILEFDSFENVFSSPKAKEIQSSILDGSYRYCDTNNCNYENKLKEFKNLREFKDKNIPSNHPVRLVLSIDDSCNLQCPSCRVDFRFVKSGNIFEKRMRIAEHLAMMVSKFQENVGFEVSGDGDPFASIVYRKFLENTTLNHPQSYLKINTNGILLKDHWNAVKHLENKIDEVKISLDAGSESVYDKTRRLGTWDKVIDNIKWLVEYRKINKNKFNIATNFVVQKENVHDIINYKNVAMSCGVNRIYYQKVNNWGTWRNFSEHDVCDPSHPDYQTMIHSLREVGKNNKRVSMTTLEQYLK